ncbi:MAG: phage tail sheath protein [Lachnospiraceae bacterium]|nr:phage tail sheath protein [Lachnospiraceae bacterium]
MNIRAPEINISFTERAKSAVERGSRGIVLLGVKDTFVTPMTNPIIITSPGDIPAGVSDTTKEQIKLALLGYQTTPIKVLVYGMSTDQEGTDAGEAYSAAMKEWETIKFDYLAIPAVSSDQKAQEVAAWVKTMREKKKRIKAVLPHTAADHEGIINYTIDKNVYAEDITQKDGSIERVTTEYNCEQYCSRIAGLIAGTPLQISATYAPMPELDDCTRLDDIDTPVSKGEFIIFYDGEKVKTVRAVNSFVTNTEGKGDSYKKIKIVDAMDLIADDITKTAQDSYLGKYTNNYDNKCILLTAIKGYFKQLHMDAVIDENYEVTFDLDAIKAYHLGRGKYTEEELAALDDVSIAKLETGSHVFLKGSVTILDAMEDIDLPIAI